MLAVSCKAPGKIVWILMGAFLVLGFFWFGLGFFEWSFLPFFSFPLELSSCALCSHPCSAE